MDITLVWHYHVWQEYGVKDLDILLCQMMKGDRDVAVSSL